MDDIINNLLGILGTDSLSSVSVMVILVVQGIFVLFFIISPLGGSILGRALAGKRANRGLLFFMMLLIFDIVTWFIYVTLRYGLAVDIAPLAIIVLSAIAALVFSFLLGFALDGFMRPVMTEVELERQAVNAKTHRKHKKQEKEKELPKMRPPQNAYEEARQRRLERRAAYRNKRAR